MTVYEDILTWSATRPAWQRDALRRLLAGPLGPDGIKELKDLCLDTFLAEPHAGLTARPLTAEHLPIEAGWGGPAVKLVGVKTISDVNALADGQFLGFAEQGLTIIYGDNGAGKSGYSRVLKRVCRARGATERVLPNVFHQQTPPRVPAATVNYRVGDVESSFVWKEDAEAGPVELSKVSAFDAYSVPAHLDSATAVAYLPSGLELFEALADACDRVRLLLDQDLRSQQAASRSFPTVSGNTFAARIVQRLGSAEGVVDEIERLAALTPEETTRLQELSERLALLGQNDPSRLAAEEKVKAARLRALAARIQLLHQKLSNDELRSCLDQAAALAEARAAAELARTALDAEPLANTGSTAWKGLWEAARAYSTEHAYHDHQFPFLGVGATCVLCQQPLDDDARRRLARFDQFVNDQTQQKAQALAERLRSSQREKGDLAVSQPDDDELVAELELLAPGLGQKLSSTFSAARGRRDIAVRLLAELGTEQDLDSASPWPSLEANHLDELAKQREEAAEELLRARDTKARVKLEQEVAELRARTQLAVLKDQLLEEHQRLLQMGMLRSAIQDCNTYAVTMKHKELAGKVITDTLKAAFVTELNGLGVHDLRVQLEETASQRGALYHQLRLVGASNDANVGAVLSEGERRVVALAAFLTELSTTEDCSALIFDDPVSSLDHRFRRHVARRLIREGSGRQVIVFTHDLTFLCLLYEAADKAAVNVEYRQLDRTPEGFGVCTDNLPTVGARVSQRIGGLKQRLQNSRKLHTAGAERAWDDAAWLMVNHLRAAWERAVEEVLLRGVVERFVKDVHTTQVKTIVIEPGDYAEIDRAMSQLSDWTDAHDTAAERHEPAPTPDEIGSEITALDEWVQRIRCRKPVKTGKAVT
jgi:hypothetical protein